MRAGPCWASVNRCVLVCGECVVVHRSLGRHVSDVKAVSDGDWPEGRLQMIYELSSAGSNSVWEHTLLDLRKSAGRTVRKPVPTDPARLRNEFIRAKYEALAFVNKPTDDSQEDLSQQLHASCRTTNLKVSLRLLAAGADPNHVLVSSVCFPLLTHCHYSFLNLFPVTRKRELLHSMSLLIPANMVICTKYTCCWCGAPILLFQTAAATVLST